MNPSDPQQPYGSYPPPPAPGSYQPPPSGFSQQPYGSLPPQSYPSRGSAPEFNPYAPPSADWAMAAAPVGPGGGQWWFQGNTLVVVKGSTLPLNLCVKTGQPSDGEPVKRTLQWVHPLVTLTVLISPLIMIILYFVLRKTGDISYGLSTEMRKRRKTGLILTLAPLLLIVLLAVALPEPALGFLLGLLIWLVCLVVGLIMMNPFKITKIDDKYIYLDVDQRFRRALMGR
jgi:hypothetical protein